MSGGGGRPADPRAGEPSHTRYAGNPVVRILVVLAALAVLVLAGAGALQATRQGLHDTRSSAVASDRVFQGQMESVRRQLFAQVPAGSTVFYSKDTGSLWQQRIVEFAVMGRIIVVLDPAQAEYRLSVVKNPTPASPNGLRLVVQKNG